MPTASSTSCSHTICIDYAPSLHPHYRGFITTTGSCPVDKQVISYLRGRECHPFYISMCPSTVPLFPMLSLYMSVLVRPSGPTAIFGWCELLPKTFDLNGFLLFSAGGSVEQRQHPISGLMAVLSSSSLRALLSGLLSVATRHTGHDRFIASCGRSHLRPHYRSLPGFAHTT